MTTFGFVHGSWQGAWVWQQLIAELAKSGHSGIAADMPAHDINAGATEYASALIDALDGVDDDVILVGHSLGGLSIPLVPERRPVTGLVFIASGLPLPGSSYASQLQSERIRERDAFDKTLRDEHGCTTLSPQTAIEVLYNECPPEVAQWAAGRLRYQAQKPITEVTPLTVWPDVPSAYVVCHGDRIMDSEWQGRGSRQRLGIEPYETYTDHSPMLSTPGELARILDHVSAAMT